MRKINTAGLDLIKRWEGLRLTAYQDAGKGIWTIGWGHTAAAGSPVPVEGMTITREEADAILARDVSVFERFVENIVTVPLNDNEFAALVSFAYNLPSQSVRDSTLLRLLNAGDRAGAAAQFERWVYAGGKRLNGLENRRAAERALFMKEPKMNAVTKAQRAINDALSIPKLDEDGDKGPVTKSAIKQVKKAAAEASKGSALAIGSTLTVGGVVAIVQAVWSLWQGNADALTSGDTQAVIGGAVALGFGLFKIGQNVWDRWGG